MQIGGKLVRGRTSRHGANTGEIDQ